MTEPAIEAVLFDFGGVVTSSPFEGFARYETAAGLPNGLIRRINSTNPDANAWARLERSDVDRDEFVEIFEAEGAALGHTVSAAAVLACLKTELRPAMVHAIRKLTVTHKTAILTNNLVSHDDTDSETTPTGDMHAVMDDVDVVVESSKVGVRKPEQRFYEIACELLGVDPSACVFLDDLGINLKPARAMGMTTIKVLDGHQAITDLEVVLGLDLRW
jgi:putative hydrolase of the HAD superfamily